MLFPQYRKLSQQERALTDGRLITYHFYVGGATLLVLGIYGTANWDRSSWASAFFPFVAVIFGLACLAVGLGLHFLHRHMIRGPHREAYLATVTSVLGLYKFPVVPFLLGVLIIFSIFVTVLYILAG
ncbi:MAG: hypothetical protein HY900_26925 [Deltaproteobacteria bacterium]|nr:hypothetical protein [Deltaproteobacteria bacterium]